MTLEQVAGTRKQPPSLELLPKFRGLAIRFQRKSAVVVLRER